MTKNLVFWLTEILHKKNEILRFAQNDEGAVSVRWQGRVEITALMVLHFYQPSPKIAVDHQS